MVNKDINFALVEETRPPIYTAMKYWGKKPHNIWRTYIENYTQENGIYLDPFAGSAISAFEAVRAGRKAIAFDLNPLTTFIIEVLASDFDKLKFRNSVEKIISEIQNDKIYQKYFYTTCRKCGSKKAIVQNYKWNKDQLYEVGIICENCRTNLNSKKPFRYVTKPNEEEKRIAQELNEIQISTWYPKTKFRNSESFSANFINCIGGNSFSDLWTKRNLYVISKIFDLIINERDEEIKKQLLFGFIQAIHLCTKMNVPRTSRGNRPFSTSWGRAAYICAKKQMEMNPLLLFQGSCFGKQSVESSLEAAHEYLGKKPKLLYVDERNKSNRSKNFDIKYGIIDINTITDYLDEESVDFIMTDPPYGGLVQYLDLSSIWLVWLEKYDNRFRPNYDAEITINRKTQPIEVYKIKFQNAIKNLYKVLKKNGKIVFTFHNKEIKIWNAFLNAIVLAGFKIEKVIHQQNRRTGEANVANPYGTSASDFYIRCIKSPVTNLKTDKEQFEHFIIKKAIQLIGERNEPTPFQILFNGLLVEISNAGFDLQDFDENVEKILKKYVGKIFTITENNTTQSGVNWWFKEPSKYIKYPDRELSDRVEETIISLLRRKVSVTFDEVLGEIFVKYPNGLTPDIKSIDFILRKYAIRSGGRWVYKGGEIEKEFTKHTEILFYLSQIGKKLGFNIFIGKREQSENYKGNLLSFYADVINLNFLKNLNYDENQISRIEMIDMIWLTNDNKIKYIFEVENSTKFTSGLQRASNLIPDIKKVMVIPDERLNEFKKIKDPLFVENFNKYSWQYFLYSDIESLKSFRSITEEKFVKFLKDLGK